MKNQTQKLKIEDLKAGQVLICNEDLFPNSPSGMVFSKGKDYIIYGVDNVHKWVELVDDNNDGHAISQNYINSFSLTTND